ncbi:hypothetical protein SDC9_139780 [bioreactor metagenome]|uniref:Uncharacterized protein n=1 Tax=bioreactor metagenome TaxID=1076179 RepID=A0A645DTP0_9ZZZZ|nr:hypothetical protein [Oscillospiraceae bacterium]
MKQPVICDKDREAFSGLYPEMSPGQIEQLILGEQEGVAFSEYAFPSLSPDEMASRREALSDRKKKLTAIFECRTFSAPQDPIDVFFNPCELLLEYLLNEKLKGVSYRDITRWASQNGFLQGRMTRVIGEVTAGRPIKNGIGLTEKILPEKYTALSCCIKAVQTDMNVELYPGIEAKADIYKTFGKMGQDKIKNVSLSADTAFIVRDKLCGYAESYYSVAILTSGLWFALSVVPNTGAIKGEAAVILTFADKDAIYTDEAKKYFNCSCLSAGLKG